MLLETFGSLLEAAEAVRARFETSPRSVPILAQMTFLADGRTAFGEGAVQSSPLARAGADVGGMNCTLGPPESPRHIHAAARRDFQAHLGDAERRIPKTVHGRNVYLSSPDYLREYAEPSWRQEPRSSGLRDNPEHIRGDGEGGIREEARERVRRASMVWRVRSRRRASLRSRRSRFKRRLADNERRRDHRGDRAPRGWICPPRSRGARLLKAHGVDAAT